MVSPQKENGYTPISNELFEAFYRCKLLEYERAIVMCIWRKTYGWGKKEDRISNSQFHMETGILQPHICRTINSLKSKKIVTSSGNKLSINKMYCEWVVEWRKLPHQVTGVTSSGNKTLPHQVYTKEKKETIQKKEEKQVSHLLIGKKKAMNKYNETQHEDEFEKAIDYDSREEINPTPKKTQRKDKDVYALQNAFIEICEMETNFKPIKDAKGYIVIQNALKYLSYNEIIDKYEQWFKVSGRPREDLIAVTKCLSNDQVNKYRLQKQQG